MSASRSPARSGRGNPTRSAAPAGLDPRGTQRFSPRRPAAYPRGPPYTTRRRHAPPTRGSELGTPDKVIARLLDEADPPRGWGGAAPAAKVVADYREAQRAP